MRFWSEGLSKLLPVSEWCHHDDLTELSPGPVRSGEVARLLKKSSTALGPTRDGLIKKALCYSPRYGEIDFTVPMFDAFMKRWIPEIAVRN